MVPWRALSIGLYACQAVCANSMQGGEMGTVAKDNLQIRALASSQPVSTDASGLHGLQAVPEGHGGSDILERDTIPAIAHCERDSAELRLHARKEISEGKASLDVDKEIRDPRVRQLLLNAQRYGIIDEKDTKKAAEIFAAKYNSAATNKPFKAWLEDQVNDGRAKLMTAKAQEDMKYLFFALLNRNRPNLQFEEDTIGEWRAAGSNAGTFEEFVHKKAEKERAGRLQLAKQERTKALIEKAQQLTISKETNFDQAYHDLFDQFRRFVESQPPTSKPFWFEQFLSDEIDMREKDAARKDTSTDPLVDQLIKLHANEGKPRTRFKNDLIDQWRIEAGNISFKSFLESRIKQAENPKDQGAAVDSRVLGPTIKAQGLGLTDQSDTAKAVEDLRNQHKNSGSSLEFPEWLGETVKGRERTVITAPAVTAINGLCHLNQNFGIPRDVYETQLLQEWQKLGSNKGTFAAFVQDKLKAASDARISFHQSDAETQRWVRKAQEASAIAEKDPKKATEEFFREWLNTTFPRHIDRLIEEKIKQHERTQARTPQADKLVDELIQLGANDGKQKDPFTNDLLDKWQSFGPSKGSFPDFLQFEIDKIKREKDQELDRLVNDPELQDLVKRAQDAKITDKKDVKDATKDLQDKHKQSGSKDSLKPWLKDHVGKKEREQALTPEARKPIKDLMNLGENKGKPENQYTDDLLDEWDKLGPNKGSFEKFMKDKLDEAQKRKEEDEVNKLLQDPDIPKLVEKAQEQGLTDKKDPKEALKDLRVKHKQSGSKDPFQPWLKDHVGKKEREQALTPEARKPIKDLMNLGENKGKPENQYTDDLLDEWDKLGPNKGSFEKFMKDKLDEAQKRKEEDEVNKLLQDPDTPKLAEKAQEQGLTDKKDPKEALRELHDKRKGSDSRKPFDGWLQDLVRDVVPPQTGSWNNTSNILRPPASLTAVPIPETDVPKPGGILPMRPDQGAEVKSQPAEGDQERQHVQGGRASQEAPAKGPSERPSERPSDRPSQRPSDRPSERPSERSSQRPIDRPSERPSGTPSQRPIDRPSGTPSQRPIDRPIDRPSERPSGTPSQRPIDRPSERPSGTPSQRPSGSPSQRPSGSPSERPSDRPSERPSERSSQRPIDRPSERPSGTPSQRPIDRPSERPSGTPSQRPGGSPSQRPSGSPSERPSDKPSERPSERSSEKLADQDPPRRTESGAARLSLGIWLPLSLTFVLNL